MKIGKYNITLKNIKSYIQGKIRYYQDKYGPAFLGLSDHIKEQVVFRELIANPECKAKGECKCACTIPDLFYADKTCEDSCYPEMMTEDQWSKFKESYNGDLNSLTYPFKWDIVLFNSVSNKPKVIINSYEATFDAGDIHSGIIFSHTFTLNNPENTKMFILDIETSCFCTTNSELKEIEDTEELKVHIDTTSKSKGKHESLITIKYSYDNMQIKNLFLLIKYNII